MSDDVSIIPSDQIKALLTAILAGDTIQEDLELILTDDAEEYLRKVTFLKTMGLRPGDALYDAYVRQIRAGALQRTIANEGLYNKLRMIAHPELQLAYFAADGGRAASAEKIEHGTSGDVAGEDTGGGAPRDTAGVPRDVADPKEA
jgi:hypothetical protein